jgi:hypothetical protein
LQVIREKDALLDPYGLDEKRLGALYLGVENEDKLSGVI